MKPRPDYKPLTRVNGVISSMGLQKSILERQRHNEIVRNHNKKIYEQGTDWAYLGHYLDEAPEELKNREDFRMGYERGIRMINAGLPRNPETTNTNNNSTPKQR